MLLGNSLESILFPIIPDNLKERITVAATCQLKEQEIQCFGRALNAISEELKHSPTSDPNTFATIVIIEKDSFSMAFKEEESKEKEPVGCYAPVVVYPLHRWRERSFSDKQCQTAIIEELCHCLWCIRSEAAVQDKVTEVYQHIFPGISKRQLYPGEFAKDILAATKAYFDSIKP